MVVRNAGSRETRYVCLAQAPFTKAALQTFIDKCLVRPLTVVSDGLSCLNVTADAGVHERILVSASNASAAYARNSAVSTVPSNLKTTISSVYHSIKFAKYSHRYVAEFPYRFNSRFDMLTVFARMGLVASLSSTRNQLRLRNAKVGC